MIESGKVDKLICLSSGCGKPANQAQINEIFADDKALIEKLSRFKVVKEELHDPLLRYCPKSSCNTKIFAKNMRADKLVCPECATVVCFSCKEEWHAGESCDIAFIRKLGPQNQNTRISFCPLCRLKIKKNEGCNHMTCGVCYYEWCWVCNMDYYSSHCGIKQGLNRLSLREYFIVALFFPLFVFCLPILLIFGISVAFSVVMHLKIEDDQGYRDNGWKWHFYLMPHVLLGSILLFVLTLYCIPLVIPTFTCLMIYFLF